MGAHSKLQTPEDLDRQLAAMGKAAGLMALSIAVCVPARAPLVLAMKKGDIAATAQTMGLMSTTAAGIELLLNPILGRLSDKYGRKPFLVMSALVNAFLRSLVVAFPNSLAINLLDRCISGAMMFAFMNPLMAAVQDLFAGKDMQKMASCGAQLGAMFGLGFAAGPMIGSKLGGANAFWVSSLGFATTATFVGMQISETLPEERRKEFELASANPLSFVRLFKNRAMVTLAAVIGFNSLAEYANIYDINFLFMKNVFGWGQEEVGRFAAAFGMTQIAGGIVNKQLMGKLGLSKYTMLAHVSCMLGFGLLGSAKNEKQLMNALFFLMFGHQRSAEAGNLLAEHASREGMGRGEIAGTQANFIAVLKIIAPVMYGRVFADFSPRGSNLPGAPYFLICVFVALAQSTFLTYDRSSMPWKR
jgi:MFS family permease